VPEVVPEAIVGNSVAVVTAALSPGSVFVIPRTGARLLETAVYLPLVLRDAARVDTGTGGFGGLDAAMIGAAVVLLRPRRRSTGRLRMLLLCRRGLLMLWLRLRWLLMLLALLLSVVVPLLLTALCVGRSNGSEEQEQGPCTDRQFHRHLRLLIEDLAGISFLTSRMDVLYLNWHLDAVCDWQFQVTLTTLRLLFSFFGYIFSPKHHFDMGVF
jgi:hypothetical protein